MTWSSSSNPARSDSLSASVQVRRSEGTVRAPRRGDVPARTSELPATLVDVTESPPSRAQKQTRGLGSQAAVRGSLRELQDDRG
jgi:hypothetical protein